MEIKLRRLIVEVLGVQFEILKITDILSKKVFEKIIQYKDKISDGETYELNVDEILEKELSNETKIRTIKSKIDFTYNSNFKISGQFKSSKIKLNSDNSYDVSIDIQLFTDNLDDLEQNLKSVISHELNHAFVYLKKLYKKNKTQVLNKVKNKTSIDLELSNFKNKELKDFLKMFYLSLPEEVNARVQQTASELKSLNTKDYSETMQELKKFNPLKDVEILKRYNINDILNLEPEILKDFIIIFNKNINLFQDEDLENKIKIIEEPKQFFKYWNRYIINAGEKLFRKIVRLVAMKHGEDENKILSEILFY
jgi:hypothetical protein